LLRGLVEMLDDAAQLLAVRRRHLAPRLVLPRFHVSFLPQHLICCCKLQVNSVHFVVGDGLACCPVI